MQIIKLSDKINSGKRYVKHPDYKIGLDMLDGWIEDAKILEEENQKLFEENQELIKTDIEISKQIKSLEDLIVKIIENENS